MINYTDTDPHPHPHPLSSPLSPLPNPLKKQSGLNRCYPTNTRLKFLSLYVIGLLLLTFSQSNAIASRPWGLKEVKTNPKSGILVDLQYTKNDNITGRPLYPKNAKAYLHQDTLFALKKAASFLRVDGYGITVLDAWRPYIAGARLWNKAIELDLRDYYCPPKDSDHTRGTAVDITLHKLSDPTKKLVMPSEFDQPLFMAPKKPCLDSMQRAQTLKKAMNKAGFVGHRKEWWHFALPNQNLKEANEKYPVIKGPLNKLIPKMNY
jgi:D-alanyl-D-alanine dipeptidase